jgi:hypothetical protein
VLQEIGCSNVAVAFVERLGRKAPDNDKRPIKVTLTDARSRAGVLSCAKKLNQATEQFRRIYIKKDLNPKVRMELARLRDVTRKEREKPENVGKSVTFDHIHGKVFVNDVEVDCYRNRPF